MKKISMNNSKDRRLLLNERNELVFKCSYKCKFELSWLWATGPSTLDNSRDIDAG